MASKSDYIPQNKAQFLLWVKNFVKKAIEHVNHYGINQEEIKIMQDFADVFGVDISTEIELINKKLAQFKKTKKDQDAAEKYFRKIAQIIKTNLDYTEEIGREFDIIAPDSPFDPKTYQPKIAARRVSSGVEISFTKSETEGVHIYRCKQGDDEFEFLAYDVHSPYIDTKEMDGHFVYQYYVRGVIDGKEIGKKSNVAMITI